MSTTRRQTDNSYTIDNFNYILQMISMYFLANPRLLLEYIVILTKKKKKFTFTSSSEIIRLPYMHSVCSLFALEEYF